jgi:hypothetical protein
VATAAAHFDAVNVATALHKLGSCRLGGSGLQQILCQREFSTLKGLAGESSTYHKAVLLSCRLRLRMQPQN